MNPESELKKAIVSKLTGDPRWIWDIFGINKNCTLYLNITNVTGIDTSVKQGEVTDFLMSFDAWDARYSSETGTDEDIMEMLYVMTKILTLGNKNSGITKLNLDGPFRDGGHLPESGPDILDNPDKSVRHARQIIKFKVEIDE